MGILFVVEKLGQKLSSKLTTMINFFNQNIWMKKKIKLFLKK